MLKKYVLIVFLYYFSAVVYANPEIEEIIQHLPFSQQDIQQIKSGKLVTARPSKETAEEELAVVLAFVVKTTPAELEKKFIKGVSVGLPEEVLTYQALTVASTEKDFSKMTFSSDESREIDNFLSVEPGNKLNLSAEEMKQFQSIKNTVDKKADRKKAVEVQLHKVLLSRFQAYTKAGTKGIGPYQREKGKQYLLGDFFQNATQIDGILKQWYPGFYQALINYPANKPAQLQESFYTLKLNVEKRPTFTLLHRMILEQGGAFALSVRQYYVTQTYNGQQDLALFLPVEQGTLALGVFRTSTDAVTGFGGSAKRAIGGRMFASSLSKLYEQIQQEMKD
jgi:hypothetical protein